MTMNDSSPSKNNRRRPKRDTGESSWVTMAIVLGFVAAVPGMLAWIAIVWVASMVSEVLGWDNPLGR